MKTKNKLELSGTSQLVFDAISSLVNEGTNDVFTRDVYEKYVELSSHIASKPVQIGQVSTIITRLDYLKIIECRIISKGKYGRTRKISLNK